MLGSLRYVHAIEARLSNGFRAIPTKTIPTHTLPVGTIPTLTIPTEDITHYDITPHPPSQNHQE